MDTRLTDFLAAWTQDPKDVKSGLVRFIKAASTAPGATFDLVSRPGVSHSLRAAAPGCIQRPLFALADVIEDPDGRWLSICFYADTVTDPEERGNIVPAGLLGEDGRCFDYESPDKEFLAYIDQRVIEAVSGLLPS